MGGGLFLMAKATFEIHDRLEGEEGHSGARVRAAFGAVIVQIVLLDIVMPKRNGFEALRGLRKDERTKQTRVVVVSSKSQESDRIWGIRQGADEYLPKPFTPEQLLTIVRRFLK